MMKLMDIKVILVIIILLWIVSMILLWQWMRKKNHPDNEKLLTLQNGMHEIMMQYQSQLLSSLKQDFLQLNETTTNRLFSIEKNVNTNITQGYETTHKVFSKVMQQMGKMDESQQNLKELSLSIHHLQNILTDKKTRGIFGEVELYSILEMAMGNNQKRYAKQYRLSNAHIADAVLFANDPLNLICIDAKFPLENYNRIIDDSRSVEERKKAQTTFVQDVKKHIQTISSKYIIQHETAEFAYMFIPAEAIFSYIHANCEQVVNYSFEQKVYLVSPTTLMAYITAIKAIYLGQQRNENVFAIQEALKKLELEFERFEKRILTLNQDFEKTFNDMQAIQITTHKLLKRFKDIHDVHLDEAPE